MPSEKHPVVVCSLAEASRYLGTRAFTAAISISCSAKKRWSGRPLLDRVPLVLQLEFDDTVDDSLKGAPTEDHVAQILRFGSICPQFKGVADDGRLLVHCYMGQSRSAAAALICYAQALGPGKERKAVEQLRLACREEMVQPNLLMIHHADRLLKRKGALRESVATFDPFAIAV